MSENHTRFYEFGPFRLDATEQQLWRDGDEIALTPKAFGVLLMLVKNQGRVVEKDTFMREVWSDSVVEEKNLTDNISILRQMLIDDAREPRYIKTVARRGYRFVEKVVEVRDEDLEMVVAERTRARVVIEEETSDAPTTVLPPNHYAVLAPPHRGWFERHRMSLAIVTLGLVLMGGAATLIWRGWWKGAPRAVIHQSTPVLGSATITQVTNTGKSGGCTISPDGKLIAYVQNSYAGTGSLYVRQIGSNHEVPLMEPGDRIFGGTAFSADSEYIYYALFDKRDPKGALYQIHALGGPPVRLLGDFNSMFSLSPDGRRVTFYRNDPTRKQQSLMIAQLDGSGEQALFTRPYSEVGFSGMPAWSPDGKMIAFGPATLEKPDNTEPATIYGIDVTNGTMKPLTNEHWAELGKMVWMSDGSGLVLVARDPRLGIQIYYLSYPTGEVRRITNGLRGFGNYGLGITADAKTIAADSWETSAQLWLVAADGNANRAVPLTSGDYDGRRGLAGLSDGRIVYVARESGEYDFWTVQQDGTNPRALTADPFNDSQIAAAPDGHHLVFTSDRAGGSHIFRTDADGSHPQQLTFGESQDDAPDCSPDGQWVVYASFLNDKTTIWKVPISGGTPVRLTDHECVAPGFSPDGKFISCIVPSESIPETGSIDVISVEGGPVVKSFNVVPFSWVYLSARWTPDGHGLVFPKEDNQVTNLWRQAIAGGAPQRLTDFKTDIIFNYAYTQNGRSIILSRGQRTVNVVLINNFK